jgi:alkylation response protein AidB-like acyl-CoA dehydrogenase
MLRRTLFDAEHELFRDSIRSFVEKEIVPEAEAWERDGIVDKAMFRKAGANGFLGMEIPGELGGGGVDDFRFNVVINEEIQRAGVMASGMCITLHNNRATRRTDCCRQRLFARRRALFLHASCRGHLRCLRRSCPS